nr:MAG TPA: hypothetical protein [Caudoviricetes sp.]
MSTLFHQTRTKIQNAKIKIYYGGYITKLERSPTFLKIL